MKLETLKKELGIDSIDFKPTAVSKNGKGDVSCQLLAYKDARVDMDVLDEAVGPNNWQVKYKRDSAGVLQCGIGIFCQETWVWKWSCGTPSEYEAVKGEYSDAFKRAGFMWGIGRTLYNFPQVTIWLNEKEYYEKDGKVKISSYGFKPNSWTWTISKDYQEVKAECIINGNKVVRFDNTARRGRAEKLSPIEKRYDQVLTEGAEFLTSDERLNFARSSEWDVETLEAKGRELKYIIDSRKQEMYDNQ